MRYFCEMFLWDIFARYFCEIFCGIFLRDIFMRYLYEMFFMIPLFFYCGFIKMVCKTRAGHSCPRECGTE